MRYLLIALLFLGSLISADEKTRHRIEKSFKDLSSQFSDRSHPGHSHPQGLRKVQKWLYKNRWDVRTLVLQNSRDVQVTAYICEAKNRYWLRLQGSLLNVDLWYGSYKYFGYAPHDRSFFTSEFSKNRHNLPSLHPTDLSQSTVYQCIQHKHNTYKYVLSNDPAYDVAAYYCSRGVHYWVKVSQYNKTKWYGPYSIMPEPIPVDTLEVTVSTDKSRYLPGEGMFIKVFLQNKTKTGIWVEFSSGIKGDYVIDNRYSWAKKRYATMVLTKDYIPPYGKKVILSHRHTRKDYYLTPGNHRIVGLAKTRNYGVLKSVPTVIRVEDAYKPPKPPYEDISMNKAVKYMQLQQYKKARRILRKIVAQEPSNELAYYNLACVESLTYRIDKSLEYLERALRLGFQDFDHIAEDSDLDNVRQTPRFRSLMRKYGGY